MSEEFSYTLRVTAEDRILVIQLHGGCHFDASVAGLKSLAQALASNPLQGVLIDYSAYPLTYELDEFAQIADIYCDEFPAGFPVAFVYLEAEVARTIYMTRRLIESGRPSRAFSNQADAQQWLETEIGMAVEPVAAD